ncbi:MAG: hypothetical protein J0H15_01125 [Xanthomonadales bacterium]|nr:hypothetical protein [Xanthomonadales bacterium]
MGFPSFFSEAPRITLRDPLAAFLGAAEGGLIEYSYTDAVRLAGHSCPTVAGTWLMARAGLAALHGDEVPERGAIEVSMSGWEDEGTTGVMAQVFTLLTGAAAENGFHGIGGRFDRRHLLRYGSGEPGTVARLSRRGNGATVDVSMDLSGVPFAPDMRPLMMRAMAAGADEDDLVAFGAAWQDRVRRILIDHADDPALIRVLPVAA